MCEECVDKVQRICDECMELEYVGCGECGGLMEFCVASAWKFAHVMQGMLNIFEKRGRHTLKMRRRRCKVRG